MMKKQFILVFTILLITSCSASINTEGNYSTLADMFVWNDRDKEIQEIPSGIKVSYNEKLPSQTQDEKIVGYTHYQYNDDIDVKYVAVEESNDTETQKNEEDIIIKEVIIETDNPDKNAQTYTLTKRAERYKNIEDTFSPNVYAILASRVVDKFLTDIPAFFADKENSSLFIEETTYGDRFMPSTPDVAGATTNKIIIDSRMIPVVDNKDNATYILKGRLSNINTPEVPVFKYEISLYDNNNIQIDKWSDTIRQVQNDDGSWW